MTALIDSRPAGLDHLFRPGVPIAVTLVWPAGYLTGRTFAATLDAAALTVGIAGDTMVVSATAAQTTAAGVGGHVFTLTDTTGADDLAVIVGRWAGSTDERAANPAATYTIDVGPSEVAVSAAGSANAVTLTGGQTVAGAKTFTSSPLVPDPHAPGVDAAAVSYGEVADLIAAEPQPAGRLVVAGGTVDVGRQVPTMLDMGANSLQSVHTTTTETDLTIADAVVPAGELSIAGWCATVVAGGFVVNTSGGADTTTIRLRCHDGTTDHVVAEWAMPLANDASVARVWSLTATVRMVEFGGLRPCTIGSWMLDAGAVAPFLVHGSVVTIPVLDAASTATTWRLTAQHSVSNANVKAACTAAALTYAGPAA